MLMLSNTVYTLPNGDLMNDLLRMAINIKERAAEMITEQRLTSTGSSVERRMIGRCGRSRC